MIMMAKLVHNSEFVRTVMGAVGFTITITIWIIMLVRVFRGRRQ